MKNQNNKVLEHLKTHVGITALEAYNLYGITRLSARIYDLRDRGCKIISRNVKVPTRDGKATVAEYRLVKEEA